MPVLCLHCETPTKMVKGEVIYPHRPDLYRKNFWLCDCGAYCGCHPGGAGRKALGYPCDARTRSARNAAHRVFDPLWCRGSMTRKQAYKWLADVMGLTRDEAHISMFDLKQCLEVERHCRARFREKLKKVRS